jgi:hypothetical protein
MAEMTCTCNDCGITRCCVCTGKATKPQSGAGTQARTDTPDIKNINRPPSQAPKSPAK